MEMVQSQKPARAGVLQVARAVCWSFFGIRRHAAYEKDAVSLTLKQVVIAGIIGAIVFVLSLVTLVHFVTR